MTTHITTTAVTAIRAYLCNMAATEDDLEQLLNTLPDRWFNSESDAWKNLTATVDYCIKLKPTALHYDALIKFIDSDIAELFLEEAPSYRETWKSTDDWINFLVDDMLNDEQN